MNRLGSLFGLKGVPRSDTPPAPIAAETLTTSPGLPPSTGSSAPTVSVRAGVLIDGDADHFTQSYVKKGRSGGRSAALELHNRVRQWVVTQERMKGNSGEIEVDVMAFSFLNLEGWSRYLNQDLRLFAQGFSSSRHAISMTDVGSVSQAADKAIEDRLPYLLSTCNYVLLGGAHDGGYAKVLRQLDSADLREKVRILRTSSFCSQPILELALEEVRFEALFEGNDPTSRATPSTGYGAGSPLAHRSSRPPSLVTRVATIPPVVTSSISTCDLPAEAHTTTSSPSVPSSMVQATTSAASPPSGLPATSALDSNAAVRIAPYLPLIEILLSHPEATPEWSNIAELCAKYKPRPYPDARGTFKNYIAGAVREGVIETGKIPGKPFNHWMKLILDKATARELLKPFSGSRIVPLPSAPVASTSVPPVAATPTTLEAISTDRMAPYLPLIKTLLSYPLQNLEWGLVAETCAKYRPRPFPPLKFRTYVEGAKVLGIIETGPSRNNPSAQWMTLKLDRAAAQELVKRLTSSSATDVERFQPLLAAISASGETQPLCSQIAYDVQKSRRTSLGTGKGGGWKGYLRAAVEAGLVTTGTKGEGKEWVALKK